jgi:nucleoside-diphosphate-sugar epimerase
MNILITGGGGFIGSTLTPMLLREGHKVTVIDKFIYGQRTLLDCCANSNFIIVRGDVREASALEDIVKGQDFIIPLAAMVGFPVCDSDKTAARTTNYEAIKLLLSLREKGQKVIFPCTNSGYGIGSSDECTEDTPLNPISLYGTTKVAAEKEVLAAGDSLSLRFATVFGASPFMRTDLLLNDFVYRAVFDKVVVIFEGKFRRNWVHVRDAAGAILHCINNFERMKGIPYNCGNSSANLTKIQLCEKIKEHIPSFVYWEAPVGKDPDKRDYIVSNAKLEATGWKAVHSVDDGIIELKKAFEIIRNKVQENY